jgi:hypothetical protein
MRALLVRASAAPLILLIATSAPAHAQQPEPSPTAAEVRAQPEEDELSISPAEPDFTIVALPTTLRLPARKGAFRVTHRFYRSLGAGDFSDLLENFFGMDQGAAIGLEYRFAPMAGTQIGVHRSSNGRVIQFLLQQGVFRQREDRAFSLDGVIAIEGADNFQEQYSPTVGVVVGRRFGERAAAYLQPLVVFNSGIADDTVALLGLGVRLRVTDSMYLIAEGAPRIVSDDDRLLDGERVSHAAFGVEWRVGGHAFQLNFSNGQGTTLGQLARSGLDWDSWHIGFNISRKFF